MESACLTIYRKQIENRLLELAGDCQQPLCSAMRYALLGKGKLLRPRLVLATAETFGCNPTLAIDPACAIEMVHAYSLVHDDLPCMDDDDLRRGRPTVHRAFSEGLAVLAGDALLTESFHTLSCAKSLSESIKIRLIQRLSIRSGYQGMAGGQAIDILSGDNKISAEQALQMDQKKTGDLFACSLEFGAIIAGEIEWEESMFNVGRRIGIAYQIYDDLKDRSNEDKQTLVSILGVSASQKLLDESLQTIGQILDRLPGKGKLIKEVCESVFGCLNK